MLDYYIRKEQGNRVCEAFNALSESAHQTNLPTELYSGGWFDGLIGDQPRYPDIETYWSGYSLGNQEYWCKKKGITLSNDY